MKLENEMRPAPDWDERWKELKRLKMLDADDEERVILSGILGSLIQNQCSHGCHKA